MNRNLKENWSKFCPQNESKVVEFDQRTILMPCLAQIGLLNLQSFLAVFHLIHGRVEYRACEERGLFVHDSRHLAACFGSILPCIKVLSK